MPVKGSRAGAGLSRQPDGTGSSLPRQPDGTDSAPPAVSRRSLKKSPKVFLKSSDMYFIGGNGSLSEGIRDEK